MQSPCAPSLLHVCKGQLACFNPTDFRNEFLQIRYITQTRKCHRVPHSSRRRPRRRPTFAGTARRSINDQDGE